MGQTEPQFLPDTKSDRKKKFSPTLSDIIISEKYQLEIKILHCPKVERLLAWFGKEFHSVAAS
jgi:hypothetical protein